MAKLTAEQIARIASSAGVPRDQLATAVAIALAESGGETTAHNPRGLDDSYGLWQINMRGALGPDRRKRFGIQRDAELFDPNVNARAMYDISGGGRSWRAWTTYTRGTYLVHMPSAQSAVGASGDTTPVGLLNNPFPSLSKALDVLTHPGTWMRVGVFVAGFWLLLIAIVKLTGDNKLSAGTKQIIKTVVTRKVSK